MEEIKLVYDKLNKDNKNVLNLIAQGMKVAQDNVKEEN